MEMPFGGGTPMAEMQQTGVQPPAQQLFQSYKLRLISFNLNNKCFRYNA